jgi:hypothetical protein
VTEDVSKFVSQSKRNGRQIRDHQSSSTSHISRSRRRTRSAASTHHQHTLLINQTVRPNTLNLEFVSFTISQQVSAN